MSNEEVLRELVSIDRMVGLRDEARRAGDAESICIANMLQGCIEKGRERIRAVVPAARLQLLESMHSTETGV